MDRNFIYRQIYSDAWNFHKRFSPVQDDDLYWDAVVESAGEILKKYNNKPEYEFAKGLVLNVIDELDRVYRRCEH